MGHEIELRLRWQLTWSDKEDDYVAEAPGCDGPVGRIYKELVPGKHEYRWFWAFQASVTAPYRRVGATSGREPSPREAAKRVEEAWFAAIEGTSLDVPLREEERLRRPKGR